MEQIKQPKFLYRGIWRTGRICRHCGLWEYSKDTLEEFRKWIHEPKCRLDGDGLGHLWVYPYQHEIEYRERFDEEFPPLPDHL